ncbi:hypothetical protein S83_047275, partial [Arachis hypogaea]
AESGWHKEDEILDDSWVQQSRKKGPATSHLDGLNWEVLIVNESDVDAFWLPGVKIVVYTRLLEHFKSDAEIATIIGHELTPRARQSLLTHQPNKVSLFKHFKCMVAKYRKSTLCMGAGDPISMSQVAAVAKRESQVKVELSESARAGVGASYQWIMDIVEKGITIY